MNLSDQQKTALVRGAWLAVLTFAATFLASYGASQNAKSSVLAGLGAVVAVLGGRTVVEGAIDTAAASPPKA